MTRRPIGGEDAPPAWLLRPWFVLPFLLVFAVGWAAGSVFGVIVLWRVLHDANPAAAVFLGAWLLLWAAIPVWFLFARRKHQHRRLYPASQWSAGLFFGCCAAMWFAGLAGPWVQGDDVTGAVVGSAFTLGVLLLWITDAVHRQTVSVDTEALEIFDAHGPLRRTRRYELGLIRNPRAVQEPGRLPPFCWVEFEYGSKTVRFAQSRSRQEAEERAQGLARLI